MSERDPRRVIPSVESLVAGPAFDALRGSQPRARLTAALRDVLEEVRRDVRSNGSGADPAYHDAGWYAAQVEHRLGSRTRTGPKRVVNATGVVLHTNLGRAPLADAALEALQELGRGYLDLEFDLESGERGSRYDHCTGLLRELSGAAAALVVNNNAAALVLAIDTIARGRDVLVSRGELIEIGGSFRIADIVERSGARLIEVGATNKTRLADYERALTGRTAAMLKVHRSNFTLSGFVEEVDARALAALGREHGVAVVHDLGSGLLLDDLPFDAGPSARTAVADGADVVTMSGDKLLGGPQAGILLGTEAALAAMRANPLCRALRPDRLTIAALQATLALYADPARARSEIPVLRMLSASAAELRSRAERIATRLRERGIATATLAGESAVGGGAAPDQSLPTTLIRIEVDAPADLVTRRLRAGEPPVIGRIVEERVVLDPRTIADDEIDALVAVVADAVAPR